MIGLEASPPAHFRYMAQHLGPVLRLSAAGPGMDGADGIELIVVARQQHLRFRYADVVLEAFDQRAEFVQRFFVFLGKFKKHPRVGNLRFKFLLSLNLLLQYRSFLQQLLRGRLIVPKIE